VSAHEPELDPYAARTLAEDERGYEPIHPGRGTDWRRIGGALLAPLVAIAGLAIKFGGFALKFFGIFISVGAYALIWSWQFALGFVLLILVHEAGHYVEARRQGLNPALPVFVPFLGAYVAIRDAPFDPWRNFLVSAAGPVAGGLGALAVLVAGEAGDSDLLRALGYTGFLLNVFNLVPLRPLDGGFIWQSVKILRHGAGAASPAEARTRAGIAGAVYVLLVAALLAGMLAAHVPQDRL
jgi:Zn-dependent protease